MVILAVDAFLFALACVVQWIVYPGFRWVHEEREPHWQQKYTRAIVLLTMPTMVLQLTLHARDAWAQGGFVSGLQLSLVILTWVTTFAVAVPIHAAIARHGLSEQRIQKLIRAHAVRTTAWSTVFLLQLYTLSA